MSRIADDPGTTKHHEEIAFFNDLLIDLKKQLLGWPPRNPINMERLKLGTVHVATLSQCKEQVRFR